MLSIGGRVVAIIAINLMDKFFSMAPSMILVLVLPLQTGPV
jgi:hypothetical protein